MRNLTLLTDLYQLTMLNGYFEKKIHEDIVVFDMFFRKNPSAAPKIVAPPTPTAVINISSIVCFHLNFDTVIITRT